MLQTEDNRKKVLLVQANFWADENFKHPIHYVPPITLKYAEALIKKKCQCDVEIVDCAVDNITLQQFAKKILMERPIAIVISAASFGAEKASHFIQMIKKIDKNIFIIGTGHTVISNPQKSLLDNKQFDLYFEGDCEFEIANSIKNICSGGGAQDFEHGVRGSGPL